jgi:hypothetical protein
MVFDTDGFLYFATKLGVQVCDQLGRVTAIIGPRGSEGVSDVGADESCAFKELEDNA